MVKGMLREPARLSSTRIRAEVDSVVAAYAPRIWWHTHERHEAMDPMTFVSRSSLWYRRRGGGLVRVSSRGTVQAAELARLQEDPERMFLKYEEQEAGREPVSSEKAPIFWRVSEHPVAARFPAKSPGRERLLIEYWYHSAYSDGPILGIGSHQGDWEGIAMLVDVLPAPDGKFRHEPVAAYYAAHDGGQWHCANKLQWTTDGHPVAYSALGTHATYATPGKRRRFLVAFDDTEAGRSWDSWENLRPLVNEPYFGFRGAWGDIAWLAFMSGPKVPDARFKFLPKGSLSTETEALEELRSSGCDRV